MSHSENDSRTTQFVRLLKQHDRRLSVYVHSLVGDWDQAEDILQETSVRLWQQFDQFRPDGDFGAWACTIAHYMVLAFRQRAARDRLQFDDELMDLVGQEVSAASQHLDVRLAALAECVEKLNERSRKLLESCYGEGARIKDVADELGRSVGSTYTALSRIRRSVHDCIEEKLAREADA